MAVLDFLRDTWAGRTVSLAPLAGEDQDEEGRSAKERREGQALLRMYPFRSSFLCLFLGAIISSRQILDEGDKGALL